MIENNDLLSLSDLGHALAKTMSKSDLKEVAIKLELADTIRQKRLEKRMNQSQFSKFMGVTQPMVSKWESGEYNFTIQTLLEISNKLKMDFINPLKNYKENVIQFEKLQSKDHYFYNKWDYNDEDFNIHEKNEEWAS